MKNGSKRVFLKIDPQPFGMHKQVKYAYFEPVLSPLSPWKGLHAKVGGEEEEEEEEEEGGQEGFTWRPCLVVIIVILILLLLRIMK